jgi:hypothetical protein
LFQKTRQNGDEQWDRLPVPLNLNPDLELVLTKEDPIKFLSFQNLVISSSMMLDGKPRRGTREKSDVFFQILIKACLGKKSILVDLITSTRASLRDC